MLRWSSRLNRSRQNNVIAWVALALSLTVSAFQSDFSTDVPARFNCNTLLSASTPNFIANTPIAGHPHRAIGEVKTLRMMTWNSLNFYTFVGSKKLEGGTFRQYSDARPKPAYQTRWMVETIRDANPDIILVEEIETLGILERFNREFLNGEYLVIEFPGNDERGIRVGALIKRDLPFNYEIETYAGAKWDDPVTRRSESLFAREFPIITVRPYGSAPGTPNNVLFYLAGTHSKSQRDRDGDIESKIWRNAQHKRMAEILIERGQRHGGTAPVIMGGDFNHDLADPVNRQVNALLTEAHLLDTLTLRGETGLARTTHTYFPDGAPTHYSQLDAFLVSPDLAEFVVDSYVVRYRNKNGTIMNLPTTKAERRVLPSDHYPVFMKLDFERLLKARQSSTGFSRTAFDI